MTQDTFSCGIDDVTKHLGEPDQVQEFKKHGDVQIIAKWNCGCEFHETENGSGVLFTCEEHAGGYND